MSSTTTSPASGTDTPENPETETSDKLPRGMTPHSRQVAKEAARANVLSTVFDSFGEFCRFVGRVTRVAFTTRFHFREFVSMAWFLTSVSLVPAIMVAIPFCVMIIYQVNALLIQIGAIDLSGAAAAVAVVREIGPVVSVLVVAGAGATALCADLGARTIREEISAMEVLGIDPVERLVVPRVAASVVLGIALNAVVSIIGLVGGFFFSVVLQGATPGLYLDSLTLLVGLPGFILAEIKATIFGLLAGLTGCFLGMRAKGGPKGVGDAVNQTVVFAFMLLFAANSVITTVFIQVNGGS